MCRARNSAAVCPGSKLHLAIVHSPSETSGALHKYPGEVLPPTEEDNKPQDRYHSCESRSTMIQEDVITNDVHDYGSKQHQRQRYEPVHEQQRAARDLERGYHPIIVGKEKRADELSGQSRRHRPHAQKIQKTIKTKHDRDQPEQQPRDQDYDFHFVFPFDSCKNLTNFSVTRRQWR